ncbi:uncharacterized protein LOC120282616 [Dioscorea cayenensis subsp. rotundata]|uniref:Uncharacterized protein LOC120282616 n=1 Tax=Dioscorea cayennensis subsp. rotundata TaxID=55577 RepID=A0AB40CZD7_DIOCR|nr:uncharacterized protein LOC120282616 [Dioscorea cayenensis subsp. rotundata]
MGSFGSGPGRTSGWSVFDGVKAFPAAPETLMAEIDAAVAASEYARATALLSPLCDADGDDPVEHDLKVADEAYKAARAALAAGRPDTALISLQVALAACPPEKTSAISKLRALVSIASSQQQKAQIVRKNKQLAVNIC